MRIRQIAVRGALVCAAAGIGFAAWSAADDTAAHGADRQLATAEHPGGVLTRSADRPRRAVVRLPEPAAARAKAVVAEAEAERPEQDEPVGEPAAPTPTPTPSDEPKPSPTQEPSPTAEPTTPPEEPAQDPEPATDPRSTDPAPTPTPAPTAPLCDMPLVDGVCPGAGVITTPPAAPEPTPTPTSPVAVPDPVMVILPSTGPAPLPDADEPVIAPKPPPVAVPVPALPSLPAQPPVLIGPSAAEAVDPPAAAIGEIPGAALEQADPEPECVARPAPDRADRRIYDGLNQPDRRAAAATVTAAPGCPTRPDGHPAAVMAMNAVLLIPQPGSDQIAATVPSGPGDLFLRRLQRVLPRSAIGEGRTTRLDPRPA